LSGGLETVSSSMNLSQIPGFGWSLAHHPIAEISEFLLLFRLLLYLSGPGTLSSSVNLSQTPGFELVNCAPTQTGISESLPCPGLAHSGQPHHCTKSNELESTSRFGAGQR
ncbi:hypothetical protein, partial [Mycobacteroides sp. LB1]|uniref:hypothetical protein n=1 Tax=Mycobacteroides sp. LB1 TaxID=2750814 RepID=UPI001C5EB8FB